MSDVKIEIEYCMEWNFLPQASSLAAAIEGRYAIKAELVKGGGGIFTVKINGEMAYNNRDEGGRFPENEEIFLAIDKVKAPLAEGERKETDSVAGTNVPSCDWTPEKE